MSDVHMEEAKKVIKESSARGLTLRVLGGVAIKYYCPSTSRLPLKRHIADIDFFGLSRQSGDIIKLFKDLGYIPSVKFNAMHGKKRLLFFEPNTNERRDIIFDVFEMCHRFDFRKRLNIDDFAISLADLLLTKLQIIEINERDYKDITAMLLDHEIGANDEKGVINGNYISNLCSKDWGVYKTITRNLNWLIEYLDKLNLEKEKKNLVEKRARKLLNMIEAKPKSLKWKLRAKIGERMAWYELPEAPKTIKLG